MVDSAQVPLIQVQVHRGDGRVVLGLGRGSKLHMVPTIDSAQVPGVKVQALSFFKKILVQC